MKQLYTYTSKDYKDLIQGDVSLYAEMYCSESKLSYLFKMYTYIMSYCSEK